MAELAVDQLLDGKYRIVRLVGQGAWATVYEAVNVRIQRRVAIKILNVELATQPELLARFNREAEAATQIESPFVVTVFDAGTLEDEGKRPYIVMEFLEGEDLGRRLKRVGPLSEADAASYAIHLLSGLADAHATGVLHRDIKPDNLVIVTSKNGEEILKLVDFGISKPNVARPEMLSMTKTDLVLGSPVYMSPEQARGTRHMDHRSDLYSVGVVLYECVTKQVPHEADNFNELMFKVALEDAPDPRTKKSNLDPAMAEIIMKAMSREVSQRYQSAIEFRDAITAWNEHRGLVTASPYKTSKIRVRAAPESANRLELSVGDEERAALSDAMKRTPAEERRAATTLKPGARNKPKDDLDAAVTSTPTDPRDTDISSSQQREVRAAAQTLAAPISTPPAAALAAILPTTPIVDQEEQEQPRPVWRRLLPHIIGASLIVATAATYVVLTRPPATPTTTTPTTTTPTTAQTTPEGAISLEPRTTTPSATKDAPAAAASTTTAPPATPRGTAVFIAPPPTPIVKASATPPPSTTPPPTSTTVEGRKIQTTF